MNGKSLDTKEDLIKKLRTIAPAVFNEDKIDWEKLKSTFGDEINFSDERYVLNWAGKSDAFRAIQTQTTATLIPDKEESVSFDETGNIFIEGENLEVLKVLQKAYYNKIKMIYIDPPYNTGNDFIYNDKYAENKNEYLQRSGEKDEEGLLTNENLYRKNSKESGHYHSNWLTMMYPRLFLARNLLRDDGVIFVSIDDNEVHNLRMLMNEIFGEENFVGKISVQSNPRGRQSEKFLATVHDYVLIFAKNNVSCIISGSSLNEEQIKEYKFKDKKERRYRLLGLRQRGSASLRKDRPFMYYPIYVNPKTRRISLTESNHYNICVYPKKSTGQDGRWMWSKEKVFKEIDIVETKLISTRNEWDIFVRDYLDKEGEEKKRKIKTIWSEKKLNNQNGTVEVKNLFNGNKMFDFPKAVGLIKKIIEMVIFNENDICLDFFPGSCTTAHAVLDLNKEDASTGSAQIYGNRKFIMVQLPEKTDEKSEAYKAGFETIADIGKERIRRVIKRIEDDRKEKLNFEDNKQDLGFKVFKLQESNFKIWRGDKFKTGDELEKQLNYFVNPVKESSTEENMLYELLLKSGIDLNCKIGKIPLSLVAPEHCKGGRGVDSDLSEDGVCYYLINENELVIALSKINEEIVKNIIKAKPQKVITLDKLFEGNDKLKTNTILQMKDAGIEFKVV